MVDRAAFVSRRTCGTKDAVQAGPGELARPRRTLRPGMDPMTASWVLAREAADSAGVTLRPLEGPAGADIVRALVAEVWGGQSMPRELIVAFQHAGVVLYGAFAEDEPVGFVFGFPGLDGGLHIHSHMLGVLRAWQSRGVGYALKLAQRAATLDEGIDDVRWTFDPMVAKNGWFNLIRLGAVATRFMPAFYGEMDDMINRGDTTDRFEVRWQLSSERVERWLNGARAVPLAKGRALLLAEGDPEEPRPRATGAVPAPFARVAVPRDYHALRSRDPGLGRDWREACREVFAECFDAGLVCWWMTRDYEYVFTPKEGLGV
jgi:predicted GNAT superfamily acetyltransferase